MLGRLGAIGPSISEPAAQAIANLKNGDSPKVLSYPATLLKLRVRKLFKLRNVF
jgi:hypothetical protein